MKVIEPVRLTDAMLIASSVPENDYPAWTGDATYARGARVISLLSHRVYESAADGNHNHNPFDTAGVHWIDLTATNRWAMFDEAVGSETLATGSISVTLAPGSIDSLAVLDTDAASVRVRMPSLGYDRTQTRDDDRTSLTFFDLPSDPAAQAVVTVTGQAVDQPVSVGTLLLGTIEDLGITEAGPQVGINDYSKRVTDDFGVTTVSERAWAKRMSLRSLIETASVDTIERRVAALRARPALWIGEDGYDALSIYGFFKDFSIDLALETVSYCTLTIEGLTTAGALDRLGSGTMIIFRNAPNQPSAPLRGSGTVPYGWTADPRDIHPGEFRWWSQAEFRDGQQLSDWTTPVKVAGVAWNEVDDNDPTHPKPADGATVGAPDGTNVGGVPAETLIDQHNHALQQIDDLIETYGDTLAAKEYSEAAAAARDASVTAQQQSQAARDAAAANAAASAQSATDASGFATTASGAATVATQKATEAGQQASIATAQATTATTKAGEASTSATNAASSANSASESANQASTSQTAAATAATNAAGSASAASTSAQTASTKATEAGTSATAANQAKVDAQAARGDAQSAASASQGYAATASGSAAAAAASASLSASVAGGSINKNAIFADFADGASIPGSWNSWVGTGARRFGNGDTASDGTSVEGSPWAYYQATLGGSDNSGIYQNTPGGPGWYVVSAALQLRSGTSLNGAAVLMYGLDSTGNMVAQDWIRFTADNDINGTVRSGTLTPGATVYRWSKLIRLNDPRVVTIRIYAMTGWAGLEAMTPKGLSWLRCGYRAATNAEIAAGQAATDAAAALARITTEESVRAGETSALANSISTTNSRVGGVEARTTIAESSIADLNGKTASRIKLESVAGSGRAQLSIWADANGGGGVDIVGDTTFKGRILIDNGTTMIAEGNGFGSSNQFLFWAGPSRQLNQCTEASAKFYITTNGDAYFGGSLFAGTIKNGGETTSTAANASFATGPVGSRGGTRTVTISYSWDRSDSFSGDSSNGSGGISAQATLYRGSTPIGTLNVNGGWQKFGDTGEGGTYTESMSGSLTVTDLSGGTTVDYTVILNSRSLGPGPGGSTWASYQAQRLSIIQTEQ